MDLPGFKFFLDVFQSHAIYLQFYNKFFIDNTGCTFKNFYFTG